METGETQIAKRRKVANYTNEFGLTQKQLNDLYAYYIATGQHIDEIETFNTNNYETNENATFEFIQDINGDGKIKINKVADSDISQDKYTFINALETGIGQINFAQLSGFNLKLLSEALIGDDVTFTISTDFLKNEKEFYSELLKQKITDYKISKDDNLFIY